MRPRRPAFPILAAVAAAACLAPCARAQPNAPRPATLVDRRVAIGAYGGLEARYATVRGASEALAGAELSVLLDHRLSLGVAGAGLSARDDASPAGSARLRLNYGGVRVGYRHRPERVVHATADLLVGGGGVRRTLGDARGDVDAFFVVEPTVGAEVNVARALRAGVGVSYRHVGGLTAPDVRNADLRGASALLVVRAGRF